MGRENFATAVATPRLLLCPYRRALVPTYHARAPCWVAAVPQRRSCARRRTARRRRRRRRRRRPAGRRSAAAGGGGGGGGTDGATRTPPRAQPYLPKQHVLALLR